MPAPRGKGKPMPASLGKGKSKAETKKPNTDKNKPKAAEPCLQNVRRKHAAKALALAQKIKTSLLKLVELEKAAMAEAESEFAVFSATPKSLEHALKSITNTCNIAKSSRTAF